MWSGVVWSSMRGRGVFSVIWLQEMDAHVIDFAEHVCEQPNVLFDTQDQQPLGLPVSVLPEQEPSCPAPQAPAAEQLSLPVQKPASPAPQPPGERSVQHKDGALVLSLEFGMQATPEREALWAAWAARLPQHTFTSLLGRRGLP